MEKIARRKKDGRIFMDEFRKWLLVQKKKKINGNTFNVTLSRELYDRKEKLTKFLKNKRSD